MWKVTLAPVVDPVQGCLRQIYELYHRGSSGMGLPGNGTIPAVHIAVVCILPKPRDASDEVGREKNSSPDIMTEQSFQNALHGGYGLRLFH